MDDCSAGRLTRRNLCTCIDIEQWSGDWLWRDFVSRMTTLSNRCVKESLISFGCCQCLRLFFLQRCWRFDILFVPDAHGGGLWLPRVLEYYSSNFLLLEYSLLSISGCKLHFHLQFCSHLMNCWNLWKLGASQFHLQLASPEIDLNIYVYTVQVCLFKALSLRAPGTLTHHPFFVIGSLYLSTASINEYLSTR